MSQPTYTSTVSGKRSIATYKGYKDGRVDFYGNQVLQLTGYTKEELRQLKWVELILPEDRKGAKEAFITALKSDKVYTREYRINTKGGEVRWVQEWSEILLDDNGDVDCVVGALIDITYEKNLEAQRLKVEQLSGKYLIFSLAGEKYGLNILEVKEIIRMAPITPLPEAPDFIPGIINLRGQVITVIDLRRQLELTGASYGDGACIIVMEYQADGNQNRRGILAEGVSGVIFIHGRDIEPPPAVAGERNSGCLLGLAKTDQGIHLLLNSSQLFHQPGIPVMS